MSVALAPKRMTVDEFLALPDDGVERWLIDGELRENGMTVRNRFHCRVTTRVSYLLERWLDPQPKPRGTVLTGEAGVRLNEDDDTIVGIDIVYLCAELAARFTPFTSIIEGLPTLVVAILSPSDTQERIDDKIDRYVKAGVPLIWIIDPHDRTVLVYRQGHEPQMYSESQELSGDPELPGFRVRVAEFFVD